ncbi:MAG: putative methyltransferase [Haloplasmataceae bacterium]|nr:putative methyltransferase [Haloplasmataceae bacterium]
MLSGRLRTIANCVLPYRFIVDVGTDHCFVPIYLLLNNLIDYAIGTDVKVGPFEEAKRSIEAYGFLNKIEIRLGNGLSTITTNDLCECIIIAGMGGKLIAEILETGNHIMHLNKRLVLQANIDVDYVRKWLCENHYEIVSELNIEDENIFYEIIVADKCIDKYQLNKLEIKYGPILLKEKNELFIKKYQNLLNYKKRVYLKVPEYHENKKLIQLEIDEIESILK